MAHPVPTGASVPQHYPALSPFSKGLLLGLTALPVLISHLPVDTSPRDSYTHNSPLPPSNTSSASPTTDPSSVHSHLSLLPPAALTTPSPASPATLALLVLLLFCLAAACWAAASLHRYLTRPLDKRCRLLQAEVDAGDRPGRYSGDLLPAFANTWYLLCDDVELAAAPRRSLTVQALDRTFCVSRLGDGGVQCVDERQRVWEAAECNRGVFVWYDAVGRSSAWQLPAIACDLSACALLGRVSHEVSCQLVEIPENGADTAHLATMHGPFVLPHLPFLTHTWHATWDAQPAPHAHIARLSIASTVALCSRPLPATTTTTRIQQVGPSLVLLLLETPYGPLPMVESVTPIGGNRQRLTNTLWLPAWVGRWYGRVLMSGVVGQLERDLFVWNRKRWLRRPMVVRADGPILRYRRWLRQFYDDAAGDSSSSVSAVETAEVAKGDGV